MHGEGLSFGLTFGPLNVWPSNHPEAGVPVFFFLLLLLLWMLKASCLAVYLAL